jgi:phage terminase small subunit
MENVKLTDKQKIFCDEYLIDLNATRAYKAAYKSCKKDETARTNSSRLLTNASIKNYIQRRMKDREKRTEITQDMVLQELAKIGFANATDYAKVVEKMVMKKILDAEGKEIGEEPYYYKDVELEITENLEEEKQAAMAGIKQGANGIEVKLNDKVKALELIGRHLGMFTDKVEHSGAIGSEVNIVIGSE